MTDTNKVCRPLGLADQFDNIAGLMETTGTYHFMAIQLLEASYNSSDVCHSARHDLESFYWVLLWVVMRHTAFAKVDPSACGDTFTFGDDAVGATSAKIARLFRYKTLKIPKNGPLTALLAALSVHVYRANRVEIDDARQVPLTYATMLSVFNDALVRTDWPTGDMAISYNLPETRTQTVISALESRRYNPHPICREHRSRSG
ncbi:hypothetical protein BV20DRAFT_733239 [Pilatotrama ljubarskyi]|nr:hypothetical protein BV20DRAFT_733239 [Pilatotrama ljubarskyi]